MPWGWQELHPPKSCFSVARQGSESWGQLCFPPPPSCTEPQQLPPRPLSFSVSGEIYALILGPLAPKGTFIFSTYASNWAMCFRFPNDTYVTKIPPLPHP